MAKKRTDRQLELENLYVDNLERLKEMFEYRLEFLSRFKWPGSESASGDPSATQGGGGGGAVSGSMPTADDYKGPDVGAHGQRNLKQRIAGTDKWNDLLLKVSVQEGVNPVFMKVIMAIESAGNAGTATSSAGAVGIMQIVPKYHPEFDYNRMRNDPEYAIACSCKVVKGKAEAAKRSGNPTDVHEVAWRYYGKTAAGKSYGDQAVQMYEGLGFNPKDSIYDNPIQTSAGGDASITSGDASGVIPKGLPAVKVSGGKVIIPTGVARGSYHKARIDYGRKINWKGFVKLDTSKFTFLNPGQNKFAPDAAAAFNLLHSAISKSLGWKKILITSGFRTEAIDGVTNSAHMCGCAMDIQVHGRTEALKVADIAWGLGFRGVAIGGGINRGLGFVHVDPGPDGGGWAYSPYPKYRGPGSWG